MRSAIRAIPNGRYTHTTLSDGFEEPIQISVTVTVEEDELWIDFTGSSPQSARGINVVLNYTHAYASFAIKAAISPEVPHNDGAFRPVHVSAPEGSILNCREPAPVASRHIIGHFLPGVIFGALAQAIPAGIMAGGADPIWITVWRGTRPQQHSPFTFTLFQCGGAGARATKDGLSATGFPSGVAGVPAEVVESLTPLIQVCRELRIDSGGAGQFRGGLGQSTTMTNGSAAPWSLSTMIDRVTYPAAGLLGGKPGAIGNFARSDGMPAIPKTVIQLTPAVAVQLDPPGGGGYGDPHMRELAAVLADVVAGYVSVEAAAAEYGVVIIDIGAPERLVRLPEQFQIDQVATAILRGERLR
jgi:N-methylhydantoinase B